MTTTTDLATGKAPGEPMPRHGLSRFLYLLVWVLCLLEILIASLWFGALRARIPLILATVATLVLMHQAQAHLTLFHVFHPGRAPDPWQRHMRRVRTSLALLMCVFFLGSIMPGAYRAWWDHYQQTTNESLEAWTELRKTFPPDPFNSVADEYADLGAAERTALLRAHDTSHPSRYSVKVLRQYLTVEGDDERRTQIAEILNRHTGLGLELPESSDHRSPEMMAFNHTIDAWLEVQD